LDLEGEMNNYSINKYDPKTNTYITNIGTRSKVVNESSIKSIYFRETPEILFIIPPEELKTDMAYVNI
jgi:hypothetical protein